MKLRFITSGQISDLDICGENSNNLSKAHIASMVDHFFY